MDDDSVLKTGICLQWDTMRPFVGKSRKSSSFNLLDDECHLELYMAKHGGTDYYEFTVWLLNKPRTKHLVTEFSVIITVLVKRAKEIFDEFPNFSTTLRQTYQCLYNRRVSKEAVEQLDASDEWRIICLLSCNRPLFLQMNSQTVHLSTTAYTNLPTFADKFVQASLEIPPDMERLSDDISSLLDKNILPDVKLSCGGQTRYVHRSILAARSEVFSAMFRNKMVESETGTVDVPDLEAPVLDLVLKYVYSGKIQDQSADTAVIMYEVGDKYAMHSLKMACSDWMVKNLTEENCLSFLVVADSHSDVQFKDAVISFISNHQDLFQYPTWLKFSKEHLMLAYEVFYKIFVLSATK